MFSKDDRHVQKKEAPNRSRLYEVLDVDNTATTEHIRKAYRKLALQHHPDRGGDTSKFQDVQFAYEILSDAEKRRVYDQYGEEGVVGGAGNQTSSSPEDMFSAFMGRDPQRRGGGPRRGNDMIHKLQVSLEDLYNGKTLRLTITRNKLCASCEGRGGREGATMDCTICRGHGVRVQSRQIGPGMMQQVQSMCTTCKGEGKVMREVDRCLVCAGQKVVPDRKIFEIFVEKGMRTGQKITLHGEADEGQGIIPGDVVFVVQEKEHELFKRKGSDLLTTQTITLGEALCGFTITIPHLDGHVLKVTNPAGAVVPANSVKIVPHEGMPKRGDIFQKGRLFIMFKIAFPVSGSLTLPDIDALSHILPHNNVPLLTGNEVDGIMEDGKIETIGEGEGAYTSADGTRQATDEDERGYATSQCPTS